MTRTDLKAKFERRPFRPFVIELKRGPKILIGQDTEILFPSRRPELVIAFTEDGLQYEFELSAIALLTEI